MSTKSIEQLTEELKIEANKEGRYPWKDMCSVERFVNSAIPEIGWRQRALITYRIYTDVQDLIR